MDFDAKTIGGDHQKLEDMYQKLTTMSRQLSILQGFIESKFGSEFSTFAQLSHETPTPLEGTTYACVDGSLNDDGEEYDKMPNLVSQESPSRTLGYVTVPLRQSSTTSIPHSHSSKHPTQQAQQNEGSRKRDRSSTKEERCLPNATVGSEDLMYPLHNFSDLLAENDGEVGGTAGTPEFMEMELDPSHLLRGAYRGEPPALQPIYSGNNNLGNVPSGSSSSSSTHSQGHGQLIKRGSRQSVDIYKFEIESNHDTETLKSHMDSHAGSRSSRDSDEQSALIENDGDAPPLPRLMPRPAIPISIGSLEVNVSEPVVLKTKAKKTQGSQQSVGGSGSKSSSLKRRKRYNQSRPCSLECPECGLKIRDKSRLIEHLRGHTGERPFQCSFCDKSYTRKDVLKTHMVKMHGEAPQDNLSNAESLDMFKTCE